MEQYERLRQYNRWRRGEEDWAADERGPDPKELGELIDGAADRLEVLEREHQEFFERWHAERRKREALEVVIRDIFPAAHRLALELECLLLDSKDIAAVSKWWDSAHEALEQWREFCREDTKVGADKTANVFYPAPATPEDNPQSRPLRPA